MKPKMFTWAMTLMATFAGMARAQQVLNFGTPTTTTAPDNWSVTAGGAVNAVPFVFNEDIPSFGWDGYEIGVTSSGISTGSFLPGGTLADFDGFWTATYTFSLPNAARDIILNYSGLFADDRMVLELNGNPIEATGLYGPGEGDMTLTGGGPNESYYFNGPAGSVSGTVSTGFNIGGLNTLTAIINNTEGGIDGAPASIALTQGDYTGFAVAGTISYVPEPSSFALLTGFIALFSVSFKRRRA